MEQQGHAAAPSGSHMFQNANDFGITRSHITNIQGNMNLHAIPSPVLSLLEQQQHISMVAGMPTNSSSSQIPVYSESNSYCRQLLRQGRGFPMYIPGPRKNLPVAYRKTGIAIGDVGRITPEGSFDFFFNIYLPASDPINIHIPGDFVPLSPYNLTDVTDLDFDPGNFVSTPSIYAIDGGFLEPIPGGRFVLNCQGPDGAVLALPHGAHLEKLENLENMRRYAAKHAESWYQYVNGARGRGLVNGSLYLITGCEKSKSWGMASFQDVPHGNEFQISFTPTADEDDGYRYRWHGTRCRHKQADPPLVEGTPVNQTTFIHAFAISLGEGIWGKLFGGVHVSQLADSSALAGASPGGFVPYGPQSSSTWFLGFFGGGSATGANDDTDRSLVQENTTISAVSPIPVIFHPSQVIHETLLRQVPQATVVITHDDDWREIFRDDVIPATYSQLLQAMLDSFEITEEGGTVFLRNKPQSVLENDLIEPVDITMSPFKLPLSPGTSAGPYDPGSGTAASTLNLPPSPTPQARKLWRRVKSGKAGSSSSSAPPTPNASELTSAFHLQNVEEERHGSSTGAMDHAVPPQSVATGVTPGPSVRDWFHSISSVTTETKTMMPSLLDVSPHSYNSKGSVTIAASLLNRRISCRMCRRRKLRCVTTENPPRHPCARCTSLSLVCEYVAVEGEDSERSLFALPPNPYVNPTIVPPTGYMPPYPVQSQYGGQWNPSPPSQPLNAGYFYDSSPAYAPSLPQYGGAQGTSSSYGFPPQFTAPPSNQWSQGPFPQQQTQGLPQQQRCICPPGSVCRCGARS